VIFVCFDASVPPLAGVALVTVHMSFSKHSYDYMISGKLQEHQEDDEQCDGDNCPLFVLVGSLYMFRLCYVFVGDFLPVFRFENPRIVSS
jgi:hypothetical protein